jgi:hypothetical protein
MRGVWLIGEACGIRAATTVGVVVVARPDGTERAAQTLRVEGVDELVRAVLAA